MVKGPSTILRHLHFVGVYLVRNPLPYVNIGQTRSMTILTDFQQLQNAGIDDVKQNPTFQNAIVPDWYGPEDGLCKVPKAKDLACAFHAISGCDTTSKFSCIRKKTAWKVFQDYPELLSGLGKSRDIHEDIAEDVEAFVCKLYDLNTPSHSINDVCSSIFCTYK